MAAANSVIAPGKTLVHYSENNALFRYHLM